VLALRPSVVVTAKPLRSGPINQETYQAVQEYIARNCRLATTATTHERMLDYQIEVWGDCRH
jgi:hypothetical protein